MVRDFEQVNPGQPTGDEERVNPFLNISRQQEGSLPYAAEEHNRKVVELRAAVDRTGRDFAPRWPDHSDLDLVDRDSVVGCDGSARRCTWPGEPAHPFHEAGSRTQCPWLQDRPDPIARQHKVEARKVILVRMGEHHDVDPAIPGRDSLVKRHEEAVRVRSPVHEEPPASGSFDKDCVTLSDIEDRDPSDAAAP